MKFTQEQIKELKAKHGRIYQFNAKDGKSCILKAPGLDELSNCREVSNGDSIRFDQALVDNCMVAGDEEFKTDTAYQLGLYDWLGGIIHKIEGELVEL